ncbi:hypothetical protein MJM83_32245, partial [Salmonella enterica subsp. enterica serovar Montevideo]|nr:hypothetical protein [Salmonella enterica subsp. enterica serovar Montevideo]
MEENREKDGVNSTESGLQFRVLTQGEGAIPARTDRVRVHDSVGAVVMGPYADLAEGMKVKCTGRILEVPVGRGLLGRVVNT